jgi:VanZ family protein
MFRLRSYRRLAIHLPALGWALLIAGLLLLPLEPVAPLLAPLPVSISQVSDKLAHVFLFFTLTLLLSRSLDRTAGVASSLVWAFGMAVTYGAALELIQSFLPYREAEWLDFYANAAGAACCVLWCRVPHR